MRQKLMTVVFVALLAGMLGACGVKSSPAIPASKEFPKTYPKPEQSVAPSGKTKPASSNDPFYQYPNPTP
jgi:hypothetical protein